MLRFAFKPRHPVTRVAFTADGREVITAQPFTGIAVRDRLTGEARVTLWLPSAAQFGNIASHLGTRLLAAECGRGVVVVDPSSSPSMGASLLGPGQRHSLCTMSERGLAIVRLEQHAWREDSVWFGVWHFEPPSSVQPPSPFPLSVIGIIGRVVAATPNARCLIGLRHRDERPVIVCLGSGGVLAELNSPVRWIHAFRQRLLLAHSPDGSYVALGNGDSFSVFDLSALPSASLESGKRRVLNPLLTLERPDPTAHGTFADKQAEHWLPPVAFDHAGRTMFTLGLRNRVQRIDLATGGVMAEWGWRCEPIRSLAVSPDDLTAAAGCQRGELVLWDLE